MEENFRKEMDQTTKRRNKICRENMNKPNESNSMEELRQAKASSVPNMNFVTAINTNNPLKNQIPKELN